METDKKAYITNLETKDRIPCLFNPKEYSLSKSNQWESIKITGSDVPLPKFSSGGAINLQMTLFFDTYEEGRDVRDYTEKLLELMYIDPQLRNGKSGKGRPPTCQFNWGRSWSFKAIITQMTQRFTFFLENGIPVRATVDVTFQQVEQQGTYGPQNPTSQGQPGQRTHLVMEGDRLDWIAYDVYGDATLWSRIAEANNLNDPLQLTPGQRLVIPPRQGEMERKYG